MSSNIAVIRVCEHCGNDFTARTIVTRFCGDLCAKRNYKKRQKDKKIEFSNQETKVKKTTKVKLIKNVSNLAYLNPTDASKLLMCSVRNLYKLLDVGKLPFAQISEKKRLVIRNDIDNYLKSLQSLNSHFSKIESQEENFDLNNILSIGQAQKVYNISEKALYDIIKRNNLRKFKSGKFVFVERVELDKLFKR